jgi:hypothetical protein
MKYRKPIIHGITVFNTVNPTLISQAEQMFPDSERTVRIRMEEEEGGSLEIAGQSNCGNFASEARTIRPRTQVAIQPRTTDLFRLHFHKEYSATTCRWS